MLFSKLESQGNFLFRWRSFLPFVLIPVALPVLLNSVRIESEIGPRLDQVWMIACLVVAFTGLALRMATVGFVPNGTSGRNTRSQRADRLNMTGMYSVVRNPLYLANGITIIGIVLTLKVWWFTALVCLAYWLYIERIIMAEERYLAETFGEEYETWAAKTPAFFPRFSQWRSPDLGFSLRMVLRREYNGFYVIVCSFVGIVVLTDLLIEDMTLTQLVVQDRGWLTFFVVGTVIFLTLRTLKKHTGLLRVAPRG